MYKYITCYLANQVCARAWICYIKSKSQSSVSNVATIWYDESKGRLSNFSDFCFYVISSVQSLWAVKTRRDWDATTVTKNTESKYNSPCQRSPGAIYLDDVLKAYKSKERALCRGSWSAVLHTCNRMGKGSLQQQQHKALRLNDSCWWRCTPPSVCI